MIKTNYKMSDYMSFISVQFQMNRSGVIAIGKTNEEAEGSTE